MLLTQRSPCLMVLSGDATTPPEDPDLLAKVRASQASGTHVVFVPTPGPVPPSAVCAELATTLGTSFRVAAADPLELPSSPGGDFEPTGLPRAAGSGSWGLEPGPGDAFTLSSATTAGRGARLLWAPPGGRGLRLVLAPGEDALLEQLAEALQDDDRVAEWREALSEQTRRRASELDRDSRVDRAVAPRHPPALLDLCDPALAARFEHQAGQDGGLCTLQAPDAGDRPVVDLGRRIGEHERFVLELDPQHESATNSTIVLVRRTAPQDAGKVLRVELDDEDLGPWHLGNQGVPGRVGDDVFRIPAEVLKDRPRATLSLHAEPGVRFDSFRTRFLRERDPDGLWLTELDPDRVDGPEPRFDQSARGDVLQVCEHLFLRGLGVQAPLSLEYDLAPGYQWFDSVIGVDDDSPSLARVVLRILVDGEEAFVSEDLGRGDLALPARVRLHGGGTLRLEFRTVGEGAVHANLGDPVLLR